VDRRASEHVMRESISAWADIANKFVRFTSDLLIKMVQGQLAHHLNAWRPTALYREVENIVNGALDRGLELIRVNTVSALRREEFQPFTVNTPTLERIEGEEREFLEKQRYKDRANDHFDEQESSGRTVSEEERHKKILGDASLRKLLDKDPFEKEVGVIAAARAYCQIAAYRFADTVCMLMDAELFERFRYGIEEELRERLGIYEANGQYEHVRYFTYADLSLSAREMRRAVGRRSCSRKAAHSTEKGESFTR
jgi:hypothetical protein